MLPKNVLRLSCHRLDRRNNYSVVVGFCRVFIAFVGY